MKQWLDMMDPFELNLISILHAQIQGNQESCSTHQAASSWSVN